MLTFFPCGRHREAQQQVHISVDDAHVCIALSLDATEPIGTIFIWIFFR